MGLAGLTLLWLVKLARQNLLAAHSFRGGRGKLFIGASCATPNCSLVNIYTANVIPPPEKSEPEISICHVCPPVKVM